jgi:hypothetical protein
MQLWKSKPGDRRILASHFVGVTSVGAAQTYTPDIYVQEEANYKVGHFRFYGVVNMNHTHAVEGRPDWAAWSRVANALRRAEVKEWTWCNFNIPAWLASRPIRGGEWQMCLPNDRAKWERMMTEVFDLYPEFNRLEVANEVMSGSDEPGKRPVLVGSHSGGLVRKSFWEGTPEELARLTEWCCDWRDTYNSLPSVQRKGRRVRVCAPSIPGFLGNVRPFADWVGLNRDVINRCDEMSLHLYYARAFHAIAPASPDNGYVAWPEFLNTMRAAGIRADMPIGDGEHGFSGSVAPHELYNTAVAEAVGGLHNITFFSTSQRQNNDAYLGMYNTVNTQRSIAHQQAIEDAARDLNGKELLEVHDDGMFGRYRVVTRAVETPTPPDPTPPVDPVPPVDPTPPASDILERLARLEARIEEVSRNVTELIGIFATLNDRVASKVNDKISGMRVLVSLDGTIIPRE